MLDRNEATQFLGKFAKGRKAMVPSGPGSIIQIALTRYLNDLQNREVEPELHGCDVDSAREYAIYDTHVLLGLTSETLISSTTGGINSPGWNVDPPDQWELPEDMITIHTDGEFSRGDKFLVTEAIHDSEGMVSPGEYIQIQQVFENEVKFVSGGFLTKNGLKLNLEEGRYKRI